MAEIRERLTLVDSFTGTFQNFLAAGARVAGRLSEIGRANGAAARSFAEAASGAAASSAGALRHAEAQDAAAKAMARACAAQSGHRTALADAGKAAREAAEAEAALKKAQEEAAQAASAGASYAEHWTEAVGRMDKSALAAVYSAEELVRDGYLGAAALDEQRAAAERAAAALEAEAGAAQAAAEAAERAAGMKEAAEAAGELAAETQAAAQATQAAARAVGQAAGALSAGQAPLTMAQQGARAAASEMASLSRRLGEASQKHAAMAADSSTATGALERQRKAVEDLAAKLEAATKRHEELGRAAEALGGASGGAGKAADNAGRSVRGMAGQAASAASGGLQQLIAKLAAAAGAYMSLKGAADLAKSALAEDTFEVRLKAKFGDGEGAAMMDYVQRAADGMGRTVSEVASATDSFMKLTTSPQNIARLNELSDKFAKLSDGATFEGASGALEQAMRMGSLRSLSQQTGISKGQLEGAGAQEALDAGDVSGFLDAVEKAAEAARITDEAYKKMSGSVESRLAAFSARVGNRAKQAAGKFWDAFEPAIAKFEAWLDSESAAAFFALLAAGAQKAGEIAGALTDGLVWLAEFVSANLGPIFEALIPLAIGVGAAMAAAGIAAAASWIAAAWPFLLIVGVVALVIVQLREMGMTFEDIAGGVGLVIGGLVAVVYNAFLAALDIVIAVIGGIWDIVATFVNFFGNVFNAPISSIIHLFEGLADAVLGILERLAGAIDSLFGSNLASAVSGWRGGLEAAANDLAKKLAPNEEYGEIMGKFTLTAKGILGERMDITDAAGKGEEIGKGLGKELDNFDINGLLEGFMQPPPGEGAAGGGWEDGLGGVDFLGEGGNIGSVGSVGKIKDSEVSLADEDLRLLLDMSERRYVAQVNVTQLTPDLKVYVDNRSGAPLSGGKIGSAVKKMLEEQLAMHTNASYPV
jgi:hypothetical protein